MALLSFDGKIQLLTLALNLVAGDAPIGPRDRERFIDLLGGPGWATVSRALWQRGTPKGKLAKVFKQAVGGGEPVSEAILKRLHDEACDNPFMIARFATASSMVRGLAFRWSAVEWGLGMCGLEVAGKLNKGLADYVETGKDPGKMVEAAQKMLKAVGLTAFSDELSRQMLVVSGAYRSVWLRQELEQAFLQSGENGRWRARNEPPGLFEVAVRDEVEFLERVRLPRTADVKYRSDRDAVLDRKITAYENAGIDFNGMTIEDRRKVTSKGLMTRDMKLRLIGSQEDFVGAHVECAETRANAGPMARLLAANANAIDMSEGETLQSLAMTAGRETAVAFNVDQLILNARSWDVEADRALAADLMAATLSTRKSLVRIEGPGLRDDPSS